jgi:hypothetical protein
MIVVVVVVVVVAAPIRLLRIRSTIRMIMIVHQTQTPRFVFGNVLDTLESLGHLSLLDVIHSTDINHFGIISAKKATNRCDFLGRDK